MRRTIPFWLVIALCGLALVASSILLVDYVRPAPVFCDAEGGCGVVKRTVFAHALGLPTPVFGIAGFLAIGLAQLVPGRRARLAQVVLATIGALVAAGLIAVQVALKTFCPFCAAADGSALVLLVLAVLRLRKGWDPPALRAQVAGGVFALVLAIALPLVVGMKKKPLPPSGFPEVIAEALRKGPPGRVLVIDFVDFECPFCRMTHAELAPALAARRDKVAVERKHVPLRMHAHAMDAARAACCGERLGKGEEMAELLFTVPPEALTPDGCELLAKQLGLDAERYRECVKDPAVDARIKADGEMFRAAHGHGLPTIFIDHVKLEGAQDRSTLEGVLDDAIGRL